MRKLTKDELHAVEVDLLDEFASICEREGLQYYLAYGTLIGAARHKGFIPWDDDVDVMMPRCDFERLMAYFYTYKERSTTELVHCRNGKSRFPFARIIDTRTLIKETYYTGGEELGAWVDIFPLDETPLNAWWLFARIAYWNNARHLAVSDPNVGSTPLMHLAKRVLVPFFKGNEKSIRYAQKMDESVRAWKKRDTSCWSEIMGVTERKKALPKEWFEPDSMEFESRMYCVPKHYDELLTSCYGDWRTLPPVEAQKPHPLDVYLKDGVIL